MVRGRIFDVACSLAAIGDVIALDRKACDLSRPRGLPGLIGEAQPDVIVNAAAYTAVAQAEEEEELATLVNGTAVGVLATEARKRGAAWARHIADATALIVQRANRERSECEFAPGILNLTAGGATSWCGFAEAILALGRQGVHRNRPKIRSIASSEYPRPAVRPKNSRLAGERLRERFGIALLALCMQDEALTEAS